MTAPILIMAGGTGGHVFPALAVARALRRSDEEIVWLGTAHGIESRLVPDEGIPLEQTRAAGLRGKGPLRWLLAPAILLLALVDAIGVLRRRRPKVVLGMGGFASGPGGLAAWLLRKPLIIHEQNSVAGLTNRLLAGLAREVLEAFPGSFSAGVRTRLVGNPVRRDIAALPEPCHRFGNRGGPLRLLVLGGSLGARVLNETVPRAIALLDADRRPEIRHQAGKATIGTACDTYAELGIEAAIEPFIDDVAAAYAWADLAICRAGALTISELAAAGLGAILIPYPSAVDDHQTRNAQYLVDAGAAVCMAQSDLTPARLAAEIAQCIDDRRLVETRAQRARDMARPEATRAVADACLATGGAA
ncbi:MAG: undecaprenyldiphospho-muramoylpentapeptide beta-N-acetylglucosaminyltransferase [Gammaproteobacteria bacterium]